MAYDVGPAFRDARPNSPVCSGGREEDHGGIGRAQIAFTRREIGSLEQAQDLEFALQFHVLDDICVGKILDDEHDVVHQRAELLRQARERVAGQQVPKSSSEGASAWVQSMELDCMGDLYPQSAKLRRHPEGPKP